MKVPGIAIQQYLEEHCQFIVVAGHLRSNTQICSVASHSSALIPLQILKHVSCSGECLFSSFTLFLPNSAGNFLLTELRFISSNYRSSFWLPNFTTMPTLATHAMPGGGVLSRGWMDSVDFFSLESTLVYVTPDIFAKYRADLLSRRRLLA
jgi:hypothetical protein